MALALNILGDKIDALVDMTIVYPDGVPGYGDFWLGDVSKIAVNLRKIEIPDWVLGVIMKMTKFTVNVFNNGYMNSGLKRSAHRENESSIRDYESLKRIHFYAKQFRKANEISPCRFKQPFI